MDYLKTALFCVALIFGLGYYLTWLDARDEKLMEAMETYEKCVVLNYKMSPSYFYYQTGHYPTCKNF